ncbi:MAG TPA: transcriptional repressor LexA [Symbiobacteriaceae bacterium]|nr:transcriptional repressor LexA [Symbiobacteriaceae bacterium]
MNVGKASDRPPLGEQARNVLEFLKQEIAAKGYPPSVREIGDALGLASSSTVHGHLTRLEEKGYIRRDPAKPRAIEILCEGGASARKRTVSIPVLGQVAAGLPILAAQNVEEEIPYPLERIRGDACDHFFLTVKGDSMIEAGIFNGDLLLIRRQETARQGEIIVALIEDEATVKYFFRENGRVRLQPANQAMEPIWVDDCRIIGKVVSLMRPSI